MRIEQEVTEMAVPKRKQSKSRTNKRRANFKLTSPAMSVCSCGEMKLPHRVCPVCGGYRGKQILEMDEE